MLSVSVVIPVKNGEDTLGKCLQSIRKQTIGRDVEIVILDSCSSDKSHEIATLFGAKIITVASGTFSHGGTRNTGAQEASGELLYYTVQDSWIAETDMLERMAYYFNDIDVQGVNGIQGVPMDLDKNPAVWFQRFSKPVPEVFHFHGNEFAKLARQEQLNYCRWDDVNAMYRRKALLAVPFRHVDFAEDALWALDALSEGYKLIRDSSLLVYHYHHHDFKYTFKVVYIINYGLLINFKSVPDIPNIFRPIAVNTYSILKRKQIGVWQKIYWISHNIVRHIAHLLSAIVFRFLNWMGVSAVEKGLKFFCSTIPQGRQTNLSGQANKAIL